ncbi:MAG: AAA family ATPase [Parvularculaceae bacterium]
MSEALARNWDEAQGAAARKRARVTRLSMTDFRSYARADIVFDGRPAALSGANGAGKTNILEAISLIGPGRGVRGAKLEELPRIGGNGGWAVSARVDDGEDERRFGVGAIAANPARRICRIDDRDASGPGLLRSSALPVADAGA